MELSRCVSESNCYFIEIQTNNVRNKFLELVKRSCDLPRTVTLEQNDHYWHGVCKSLIFRFPDDLRILIKEESQNNNNKGIIQIKSSSRIGISDLGINKRRVESILKS